MLSILWPLLFSLFSCYRCSLCHSFPSVPFSWRHGFSSTWRLCLFNYAPLYSPSIYFFIPESWLSVDQKIWLFYLLLHLWFHFTLDLYALLFSSSSLSSTLKCSLLYLFCLQYTFSYQPIDFLYYRSGKLLLPTNPFYLIWSTPIGAVQHH